MTATWQTRLTESGARLAGGLAAAFAYLSRPDIFPRFRRAVYVLLALWIAASLWRGLWSFLPEAAPLPPLEVINPVTGGDARVATEAVDVEALVAAQFFGEPGRTLDPEDLAVASGRTPAMSEDEAAVALAGIEDGAPATRLPLLLRGVVASSEAGLGQAVIEHRKIQDLYQVGDELPVNGRVSLAKVMPQLVVLDNGGRYEVLRLFEETDLTRQADSVVLAPPVARRQATDGAASRVSGEGESSPGEDPSALAARYRDQLYRDPESLAEVVRITAVREGSELRGYRVAPGRAAREFAALGFESGDIVTAVNGLSLADPSNTVRLYQAMRGARSASFEVQRQGETVTLDVSIGEGDG